MKQGTVSETTASKIVNAASASAEDIQTGGKEVKYTPVPLLETPPPAKPPTQSGGLMASIIEIDRIKAISKKLNLNTPAQVEKATGLKINFKGMTKNEASKIFTALMQVKINKQQK